MFTFQGAVLKNLPWPVDIFIWYYVNELYAWHWHINWGAKLVNYDWIPLVCLDVFLFHTFPLNTQNKIKWILKYDMSE